MAKLLPKAEAIVPNEAGFLLSAPPAVAQEFAKIAVNIIFKGDVAARGYAKAANALQVTVDAVDQGVKMLCNIFIRGAQSNFSSVQLTDYLKELGFHNETGESLVGYFTEQFNEIRRLVAVPKLNVPSYRKLEWRLDVQLASRSLLNQAEPSFLLKLSLNPIHVGGAPLFIDKQSQLKVQNNERTERDVIYLEANYATLKAMCNQLEQALAERRSRRSRRILRQLQS
uniref:COMM domain-containing protein n=1 Tax=Araucaria cunninghamii TaxID=56994 RepID=A0A0D6RAB5_ARACU